MVVVAVGEPRLPETTCAPALGAMSASATPDAAIAAISHALLIRRFSNWVRPVRLPADLAW
jgi:hypothetical protein